MLKPKIKIRVRNIEYHQDETAVSTYLFGDGNVFIFICVRALVFMTHGVNNIGDHNDRHYGKPVIIKPIHKNFKTIS